MSFSVAPAAPFLASQNLVWALVSMFAPIFNLIRQLSGRRKEIGRTLLADSKRSFWAMADQGVVSLGNFGVNIALARHFEHQHDLAGFGAYWVLMELMYFLNGIQGALVTYPLTVRGAVLDQPGLGKLTTQSLAMTLLGGPMMILALMATGLVIHLPLTVGLWAGVAIVIWQLQETTRRALMSQMRFRAACVGDAISYGGQFLAVVCLAVWGHLDVPRTFQAIAVTSALGCLFQAAQLGLRTTRIGEIVAFARHGWEVGKWLLLGNLTSLFSGALFNWNLAYWAGLEVLGVYYALFNLIRPAHPLAFAVATLVTPHAARTRKEEGMERAKRISLRLSLLGALLLLPFLGVLIVMPKFSLALAYGWESSYLEYSVMVQLAAIAAVFVYAGTAAGAFLNGIERTRETFFSQAIYAVAFVVLVMPLTAFFGLSGAFLGRLLAAVLGAGSNLLFAYSSQDDEPKTQIAPG